MPLQRIMATDENGAPDQEHEIYIQPESILYARASRPDQIGESLLYLAQANKGASLNVEGVLVPLSEVATTFPFLKEATLYSTAAGAAEDNGAVLVNPARVAKAVIAKKYSRIFFDDGSYISVEGAPQFVRGMME